ncbi:MAG: methylated-DNA--[protein]-cysteine S-methyltransferase [Bdellovibrionales bacterium]|nr:methylated-DNA--[protein]-cysteine S-methyltransferase [Bdellovibrionales bacterium]
MDHFSIKTPIGHLQVIHDKGCPVQVTKIIKASSKKASGAGDLQNYIKNYFVGHSHTYKGPLKLEGTDFQKKVWQHLRKIPYGKTQSYAEVAKAIGHPKAARAVGTACGKNPLLLLVPCHRVVATNGSLGGFALGLKVKKQLLQIEQGIF